MIDVLTRVKHGLRTLEGDVRYIGEVIVPQLHLRFVFTCFHYFLVDTFLTLVSSLIDRITTPRCLHTWATTRRISTTQARSCQHPSTAPQPPHFIAERRRKVFTSQKKPNDQMPPPLTAWRSQSNRKMAAHLNPSKAACIPARESSFPSWPASAWPCSSSPLT